MFSKQIILATLLAMCGTVAVGAQYGKKDKSKDLETIRRSAYESYESERYADCGKYFAQAGAASAGAKAAGDYYNAGCCYALAGDVDAAFEMLGRAIDAGYSKRASMAGDSDLVSLRADPRMDALLDRIVEPEIVITDNIQNDPDKAQFVFDDAYNFIRAMELVAGGAEIVATLEAEYFAKATPGLKQMVIKYPFTAEDLAEAIASHEEDYARIAKNVEMIETRLPDFHEAYRRFKEIAPSVIFPSTYFLVDVHRGIGSGSPEGQLITIESRSDESISRLETLLIHELTHFQQLVSVGPDEFYALFGAKKSLLGLTIREGTAEFFADMITNRITQQDARDYVINNEAEIWERFTAEMSSAKAGDWMWSKPSTAGQPRDIAYVLGSRIVAAYYNNVADKDDAGRAIFAVVDYEGFLENSGYAATVTSNPSVSRDGE